MSHLEQIRKLNQQRAELAAQEAALIRETLEDTGLAVDSLVPGDDGAWRAVIRVGGAQVQNQEIKHKDRDEVARMGGTVTPAPAEAVVLEPTLDEDEPVEFARGSEDDASDSFEETIREITKESIKAEAPKPVEQVPLKQEVASPGAARAVDGRPPMDTKPESGAIATVPQREVPVGDSKSGQKDAGKGGRGASEKMLPFGQITLLTPEQQKREKENQNAAEKAKPATTVAELQEMAQKGGLLVQPHGQKRENQYRKQVDWPSRAVRLARTLVSDIVAYRDEDHKKALEGGVAALREVFAADLDKAKERFYEQAGEEVVPNRDEIFANAVNEILGFNLKVWD